MKKISTASMITQRVCRNQSRPLLAIHWVSLRDLLPFESANLG